MCFPWYMYLIYYFVRWFCYNWFMVWDGAKTTEYDSI